MSSGADSAYCKELKTDKTYFSSLSGSSPDVGKLDEAFKRLHSLADRTLAPSAKQARSPASPGAMRSAMMLASEPSMKPKPPAFTA